MLAQNQACHPSKTADGGVGRYIIPHDAEHISLRGLMPDSVDQLLSDAVGWAKAGGALARDWFGRTSATRKADDTLVTEADHAVQEMILNRIATHYPEHAVLTEETMARPQRHADAATAEWCWVIDPIDGTRNFARGIGAFSVSVAVLQRGRPVVGVVYSVMDDATYIARRGSGAWCGDRRLAVVDEPPSMDTLIGSPSGHGGRMRGAVHDWLDSMTLRSMGSVAIHLALVAAGAMDAAFCVESKLWDIAAGALLVAEAGGVITDLSGDVHFPYPHLGSHQVPRASFLAAGPKMHAYLLESWKTRV